MKFNNKILNAINEGIEKALIQFDDDIDFSKSKVSLHNITNNIINFIISDIFEKDRDMTLLEYKTIINSKTLYVVRSNEDLKKLCNHIINNEIGPNPDLNWINVSNITNMKQLFAYFPKMKNRDISSWEFEEDEAKRDFNGDISKWDTSNVKDMADLFLNTKFRGDISNWSFDSCLDFSGMFCFTKMSYEEYQEFKKMINKIDIDKNHINICSI